MAPLYGLVVWAMGDYESLRHFLATATNPQLSQMVLSLIVAGFCPQGLSGRRKLKSSFR